MLFGLISWVHMSGNNALLKDMRKNFLNCRKNTGRNINGHLKNFAIDSLWFSLVCEQ